MLILHVLQLLGWSRVVQGARRYSVREADGVSQLLFGTVQFFLHLFNVIELLVQRDTLVIYFPEQQLGLFFIITAGGVEFNNLFLFRQAKTNPLTSQDQN